MVHQLVDRRHTYRAQLLVIVVVTSYVTSALFGYSSVKQATVDYDLPDTLSPNSQSRTSSLFALLHSAMAPHVTSSEQDVIRKLHGGHAAPDKILTAINKTRRRDKIEEISIDAVRRFVKGLTHRAGPVEKRGRKRLLTRRSATALNSTRKALIKKSKGEYEVHWKDVIKGSRVTRVSRQTASRALKREGINVEWRRPREKPCRGPEHIKERMAVCAEWKDKPTSFFTGCDLIIDNKKWDFPTTDNARSYVRKCRVRGHLRTPGEGVAQHFTKPSRKRNRVYTASINLCAGISKDKVALWTYLPKKWNGEEAATLVKGPIIQALRKTCGEKRSFRMIEDNDPVGYKSKKAKMAKKDLKINTVDLPRYSPDLNPLDFFLWAEVERRLALQNPKQPESMAAFKARMRRVALNIPSAVIRKAVASMKKRAQAIYDAKGHDISLD